MKERDRAGFGRYERKDLLEGGEESVDGLGGGCGDDVQVREFESARDLCQQVRSEVDC